MNLKTMTDPFDIAGSFIKLYGCWIKDYDDYNAKITKLNRRLNDLMHDEFSSRFSALISSGNGSPKNDSFLSGDFLLKQVKSNAVFARKLHKISGEFVDILTDSELDIEENDLNRAKFWLSQVVSCFSPANYFWTNPLAVKKFIDSEGESLLNGIKNLKSDLENKKPLVSISNEMAFKIGENLAYTPGQVIYQNELMELIQYYPSTEKTFELPILLIQPWVNKYYIFDLAESNSMVKFLRDQGFTVFITSWKNPGKKMKHIGFEEYMIRGALKAVEIAKNICNVKQIHAAGYCIGGTVLAALLAWLNREAKRKSALPIAHWSVFSSLTDFSNPGELEVFIHEDSIEAIETMIISNGYLDNRYIETAFRLLRPDSLIWRYVAHNYLQGGSPPASDMLYWNSDGTRLPAKMALFYIKEVFLKNRLVQKDDLVLAQRPIDLGRIGQPLYAVGTLQDHISPWKETFKTCSIVSGPARYVLSAEGHITGIVNPPHERSRKKYWVNDTTPGDEPDIWFARQDFEQGSWWTDWIDWLSKQCGDRVSPPQMGNSKYKPVRKAPGLYVHEK